MVESASSGDEDELPRETEPLIKSVSLAPSTVVSPGHEGAKVNTSLESEEAGEREGEIREEQSEDSDTDEVCRTF